MIQQGDGGRIVNVTSVHEFQPRVGAAPYCAAKGGLGLLTQVMALELAEYGITVNAVAPGEIATPMTGQEDRDVRPRSAVAFPWGVLVTRGKSPPSSPSSRARKPPTSRDLVAGRRRHAPHGPHGRLPPPRRLLAPPQESSYPTGA